MWISIAFFFDFYLKFLEFSTLVVSKNRCNALNNVKLSMYGNICFTMHYDVLFFRLYFPTDWGRKNATEMNEDKAWRSKTLIKVRRESIKS